MDITIENYNPEKHNKHTVGKLMYNADIEMNNLFFGEEKECIRINEELISLEKKYLTSENIKLAIVNGEIAGLMLGYNASQIKQFHSDTGKALLKAMGLWWVLKKILIFIKARKLGEGFMEQGGYYIYVLSVDSLHRGKGIGAQLIEMMMEKHSKLYLHVNTNNHRGQKFYKKMGFEQREKSVILHNGKEIGTYLMEK
ncbi:MAG: GNAT family N-acetyltransferase [Alkaliphilus sp.]